MRNLVLLLLALLPAGVTAQTSRYKEGQVWAYRTRPGDEGSLLKIQQVDQSSRGLVYHLSVIGFHFHAPGFAGVLPHEPVSQATLDASVTEQRPDPGTFPSADEGITEWRAAHGGVFTITIAQTLDMMDRTLTERTASP